MQRIQLFSLVVVFLLIISGCAKKEKTGEQETSASPSAQNVAEVTKVEKRGDQAPNFSWTDASGKQVDLESFRGKVTLVNFWATWCGPCRHELPDLIALSNDFADRGVRIIGVSTDRGNNVLNDVKSFVQQHGIPYQIVISNSDLEEAFGSIRAVPTSFIIDRQGKIVQTIVGSRTKEMFAQAITPLLN